MTTLATSNPTVTVQGPLTTNGATGIIGQPAQAMTTTTSARAHGGACPVQPGKLPRSIVSTGEIPGIWPAIPRNYPGESPELPRSIAFHRGKCDVRPVQPKP